MSKNMKGVLGEQYGKVGPVVARKFRTDNVYSAYQKNVANPRTEQQEIQRMKFKTLSQLAHNFACGARMGFLAAAKGTNKSPRNVFQKVNWPFITAESVDSLQIDYASMQVAKGGLCPIVGAAPNFDTPLTVKMAFTRGGNPCQRTTNDKAYLFVYCPDTVMGVMSEGVDANSNGNLVVTVPDDWNGLKVHCWCFARNEGPANEEFGIAQYEASPSLYCGSGNIG